MTKRSSLSVSRGSGTVMVTLGCAAALPRETARVGAPSGTPETSSVRAGSSAAAAAAATATKLGEPPAAAAVLDFRRGLRGGVVAGVAGVLRPAFGVVPRELDAGVAAPTTGAASSAIWVAGMILFTSSIRAGGTVVLAEKEVGMGFPRMGRGCVG